MTASLPALPLHTAGPYVAAAYIVFVVLILVYVAIMATKLVRIERDLGELLELTGERIDPLADERVETEPTGFTGAPIGGAR